MGCSITRAPPRDATGRVEPHDHDQIRDADIMLRGIPKNWIVRTEDGGRRISTGAFQESSQRSGGGMSLGSRKVLQCCEKSVDEWAEGRFLAVVCFPASELRDEGIRVGWDPTDDDPAHCNAWGKFRKPLRKRLAKQANRRFFESAPAA